MNARVTNTAESKDRCALCLKSAALRVSHFVPASLYKLVTKFPNNPNEPPVIVTAATAVQTSFQHKQKLLCASCEQLLSAQGERIVCGECWRDIGEFRLRDKIGRSHPSATFNNTELFFGEHPIVGVNQIAYAHFALSIIWRGSVVGWKGHNNGEKLPLGNYYQERFRRYLIGEDKFPAHVFVAVSVDMTPDPNLISVVLFPIHHRVREASIRYHQYFFRIPGVQFDAMVGRGVDSVIQSFFGRSGLQIAFCKQSREDWMEDLSYRLVTEMGSAVPKGKLAKKNH